MSKRDTIVGGSKRLLEDINKFNRIYGNYTYEYKESDIRGQFYIYVSDTDKKILLNEATPAAYIPLPAPLAAPAARIPEMIVDKIEEAQDKFSFNMDYLRGVLTDHLNIVSEYLIYDGRNENVNVNADILPIFFDYNGLLVRLIEIGVDK
jgi:hypothetical protein